MPDSDPNEDFALIAACVGGEPGAFERLVASTRRVIGHAVRRVLERAGAGADGDLFDDAFSRVLAALVASDYALLRRFGGRSRLTTYLAVVARRIAQRTLDERRRRGGLVPLPASIACGADGPHQSAARREERAALDRALEALPARDALALRLFHEQGLKHRQVAGVLGVPVTHVGQILARAREKLRVSLAREGVRP